MIVPAGDLIASLGSIQSESALCMEVSHGFYMHAEGYRKERNERKLAYRSQIADAGKNRYCNNAAQYTTTRYLIASCKYRLKPK